MGHHCCVPNCTSNSRFSGKSGVTFHSFPVDPKERNLWILAVQKDDSRKISVNRHTKVCSKHFPEKDFVQPVHPSKRRMLKKGAVPSIFECTQVKLDESLLVKNLGMSKNGSGGGNDTKISERLERTPPPETLKSKEVEHTYGKSRIEPSVCKNSEDTMERKTNYRNGKLDTSGKSESLNTELPSANSSCLSPTKSDDSEQGSVSDLTATNGSSPNSSNNGTPGRKQTSLNFQIGTRLEAKDLGNEMWYPVKVVEVDWDDEEILIHFEKWSQRYDEWIPMDSSRLRPVVNPNPNDAKNLSKVFSVGDRVMAKWSDCRRYPAKVKTVLGNDRYEVLFFDGFIKNMKGVRMSKFEGEVDNLDGLGPGSAEKLFPPITKPVVKNEVTSEAIGTKEERRERKRKLNVVELFHPKKRMRLQSATPSPSSAVDETKGKPVAEKRRRRKDSFVKTTEGDNEGEKPLVSPSTNGTIEEAVLGTKTNETVEEKKVDDDDSKRQKKIGSIYTGGGGESAAKPRRGLRQGEAHGKAKTYSRKNPRKILRLGQESTSTLFKSRRDSSKGLSGESETPRGKKKESSDDTSKSASRSVPKENDGEELDKWDAEDKDAENPDEPRKSTVVPDKNLPSGWSKHTLQRMHGNSAGKWDVFLMNAEGRKFRSRNELRLYFEEKGEPFRDDLFDFCLSGKKRTPRTSETSVPGRKRVIRSGKTKMVVGPGGDGLEQPPPLSLVQQQQLQQTQRRVKTLLPKIRRASTSQGEDNNGEKTEPVSPPPPYTTTVAPIPAIKIQPEMLEGEVLVGGLKIQMENNTYKCPKDGCGKNFRKENLLQMHLKHYHPEYNKFMGSTPNVADLAYARTIGESIDDLMPKSRYSGVGSITVGSASYHEKINRFETTRKTKAGMPVGTGGGKSGVLSGSGGGGDCSPVPEKKKMTPKEKQQSSLTTKKLTKGMAIEGETRALPDEATSEKKEPVEEKTAVVDNQENAPTQITDVSTVLSHREDKKEPQTTIKTLMPVIRSPSHVQPETSTDRLKSKFPAVEEGEEYIEVIDVGPRQTPPAHASNTPLTPQVTVPGSQGAPNLTKSLRTIRRRRLSDFHFEPLHKRRKIASTSKLEISDDVDVVDDGGSPVDVVTPAGAPGTLGSGKSTPTYRYSKKKTPIVHLEKLNVVPDSNAEPTTVEHLRKEELINCTCGFMEEDGLMIQCDLCLCWQHGICNNIEKEAEVPEKYVCSICLNPYRQRKSKKYIHDQDWLKEGKLPSLSFHSKNETNILEREAILKRSHDLTGSLLQIQQVLHSLRVKVNIAGKSDHPKLYLWAKSWEKDGESSTSHQVSTSQTQEPSENEFKSELENSTPCSHSAPKLEHDENPINAAVDVITDGQKAILPETVLSKTEHDVKSETTMCDTKTEESDLNVKQQVESETHVETEVIETGTVETEVTATGTVETEVVEAGTVETEVVESETVETEVVQTETVETEVIETEVVGTEVNNTEVAKTETSELLTAPYSTTSEHNEPESEVMQESVRTEIVTKSTDDCSNVASTVSCEAEQSFSTDEQCISENSTISTTKIGDEIDANKLILHTEVQSNDIGKQESESVKNSDEPLRESQSEDTKIQIGSEIGMLDVKSNEKDEVIDVSEKIKTDAPDVSTSSENVAKQPECVPLEVGEKCDTEKKSDSDETVSQLENHGLLHQALTNGSPTSNPLNNGSIGSQLDTSGHPMLQLPICQSELMQFASTMADNLSVAEPARPSSAPVPVPEPPRAPQPEAPIDPVECRLCLLDHIDHFQAQIDTRLTMLEEQVAALESQDPDAAKDEAPDFYPQTKQTVQMLLRDLLTLRKISALN